jgi:hypothetical protein
MTRAQQSAVDAASCVVRPHRRAASEKPSRAGEAKSENNTPFTSPALSAMGSPKLNGEKMGGLALPDVVRELLKDPSILLWDAREQVYEVLDGDLFEARWLAPLAPSKGAQRPSQRPSCCPLRARAQACAARVDVHVRRQRCAASRRRFPRLPAPAARLAWFDFGAKVQRTPLTRGARAGSTNSARYATR